MERRKCHRGEKPVRRVLDMDHTERGTRPFVLSHWDPAAHVSVAGDERDACLSDVAASLFGFTTLRRWRGERDAYPILAVECYGLWPLGRVRAN